MTSLFDSKNRDIDAIVTELINSHNIDENCTSSETEVANTKEVITEAMYAHYSSALGVNEDTNPMMAAFLMEDAKGAGQMFVNNIQAMNEMRVTPITESTERPHLHTLTASIAVTMRQPYEATLHRLYDTRTLDKATVEIEDVKQLIKAPLDEEYEDFIDAFDPKRKNTDLFIDKTEMVLTDLQTEGLTPGNDCKNKALNTGLDPLLTINRDMRITGIKLVDGSDLDECTLRLQKGSTPYFQARDCTLRVIYEAIDKDGNVKDELDVTGEIDFKRCIMKRLTADARVDKVYFYATMAHDEHLFPIKMSYENSFEQFTVPTRPHIEVSLTQETKTDIGNSIQYFADHDIITAMTEQISKISSRMEDQRLYKGLMSGHMYEAMFNFEPPTNFKDGNLAWLSKEFIPFLDQIAVKIKNDYNMEDCHFRIAVSPYILRLLDTEHIIDKSLTEDSRGSGPVNYSIGVKTSTSQFYFISSVMMDDNVAKICVIPNNFKMTPVRTYNYFKYASFLTDTIRRSDNSLMPAITYTERNLPIVFTPLACDLEIANMPITMLSGDKWYIRPAGAVVDDGTGDGGTTPPTTGGEGGTETAP